ncbi:hypothetical protein F0L68_35480 [Solihabitans fulvus]|uniref:Uncharacterized protein n=1 Tax=Solihabitans fulvus TaxID=1892852 RepID=A0A5B2WN30_9PSEU|nr:hypothetical protein [Solihabitans fulvus]KAA2252358.1 hypothetical protein F0L68_35480 [Solihabitans fulvus]
MRTIRIDLPDHAGDEQVAGLAHALWAVVATTGLAAESTITVDERLTDSQLNAAFDTAAEHYPWGP